MASVLITDCKKGDTVFFRKENEPQGTKPAKHRIGKIASINKQRQTVLVSCRAVIDGQLRNCLWYIKPSEIIGFHIEGTPV